MKKKKIVQQSRKVFSAVIAASVIVSSAVPETILAADFDDVEIGMEAENEELTAQTEELTAESESETSDNELTVIEDDQTSVADVKLPADDAEADLPDNETDVYSFADGEAVFSDGETVAISESAQELQNRIDALPTVEEFKNMADGETVEGSALNQKQMDVYNEVQAIAEIYDGLTKEEQAQVDTEKLEALCGYFNAQTDTTVYLDASSVKASGLTLYADSVRSLDIGFHWPENTGETITLVVLDKDIGKNNLVNQGYTGATYNESMSKLKDANINVVSASSEDAYETHYNCDFNAKYVFRENQIPLNTNKTYYLYVWTYTGIRYYPDIQVLQIKVENGNVYFSQPTSPSSFKILKFGVVPTVSAEDWTYGESAKTPKVTAVKAGNDDVTTSYGDADVTYTYYTDKDCKYKTTTTSGADTVGGVPSYAGTYYVQATVSAKGDYSEGWGTTSFKIEKAEQKAPAVYTLYETVKGAHDGMLWNLDSTMEYRKEGESRYTSVKGDKVTDLAPGMYYVRYREDTNHKASEDRRTEVKEGRLIQVTVPEEQIGYILSTDKNEAGWNESVTLTFALKEGYSKTNDFRVMVNDRPVSLDKDGTYTITVSENADVVVTVAGVADITAPVVTGVEDDATYIKTVEFTAEDANLDKVTVDGQEVTPDENGKYTLVPKSGTYTITAADKAGNVTEIKNVAVNWQDIEIPSADSKVYTGDTLKADIADTADYTVVKNNGGINVGSYEIVLELADTVNTKWQGKEAGEAQATVGFEITKADLTGITAPEAKTNLVYNGRKQALLTEVKVTGGILTYKTGDGEWTEEVPSATDAGEYQVTYKIVADENHNEFSEEKQLTVTIVPKAVTVTAVDAKKNEGAKDPKLTYKAEGLAGNDKLTDIVISRKAGEKAGTYAITVSQKDGANPNYSITFKNAVFTIVRREISAQQLIKMNLPVLLAKGNGSASSVNLSWNKANGATGYEVYGASCDGKQNFKKLATVKNGKTSIQHKKLKKNGEYKYFIAAYKMADGNKVYLAKSETLHVALKQSAKTNAKTVSVKKKSVTLRKGKTFQIKAGVRLANAKKKELQHEKVFRYYVVNSKIATVSKTGKIKAKSRGTTTVYVIANNGAYSKVKVIVK